MAPATPSRVRLVEPDHVAGVIARANELLTTDLRRDSEMVEMLGDKLTTYAAQRRLERLHPLAARDLQANTMSLRQDLEAFAGARRVEVSGWWELTRPTRCDAMQEPRDRTVATGRSRSAPVAKEIGGTATDAGQVAAGGASALGQDVRSRAASLARRKLQRPRDHTDDPK